MIIKSPRFDNGETVEKSDIFNIDNEVNIFPSISLMIIITLAFKF